MRTTTLALLAAALLGGIAPTARAVELEIAKGDVVVVPVKGEVSPPMFMFLRRALKHAESVGARAVVLEMNTFGGRLDSAEQITNLLNQTTVPTYTFINTNAGSAGALIAIATQHIYMAPVSAIGAAAPVLSTGEDLPLAAREKTISYWTALIRGTATKNGHNPDVAEAFMDKDKEVKIGNRVISPKDKLLSLNAQEAAARVDGKPVLAAGIVSSVDELVQKAELQGRVVAIAPTGFEQLAFWITKLAPVLLLGGMIGAYLELKMPGFGVPGAVATACFALFFLGHYFAGLAGWEVMGIFVVGVILLLIELLVLGGGTVIVGGAGVLLMLGALVWAMMDRFPGQNFLPTAEMLRVPLMNLLIATISAGVVIALLARYLPRTSAYKRFVLSADLPPGPSLTAPARNFVPSLGVAPGAAGTALTMLRPSGKARIGEQVVDVVTEGEFIDAGTAVEVASVDGMRVVVKAAA